MDDDDRPVLDQVNLVVGDMDGMAAFYRLLGVDIMDTPPPWDAHHRSAAPGGGVDLDLDSRPFARMWDEGWPEGRSGVVIGFRLPTREAVDRAYDRLTAAGHTGQQPPYDAFWGARYAVVADPDGNGVGLMSPVDPDRQAPPPTPPA